MSIATVVTITGQAWARDPDGNLRELAVGDVLQEGETLVTSTNGSVQLDFDDGLPPTLIGGNEEVAITNDVDAENAPTEEETVAQDGEVEALLSALEEEDGDILELLEATAAGGGAAGGGGGGGADFVQLARIEESVQGLQFEYAGGVDGGPPAVEFAEAPVEDDAAVEDTDAIAGIILNPIAGDDTVNETEAGQIVTLTGSVTGDAGEGDTVTLTIGDQTYSGLVDADGNFAIDVDGDVLAANDTVSGNVTGTDDAGNEFSADTDREYAVDTTAEAGITIDPVTDDNTVNETESGQTIAITGSVTGDAAEGDTVTLTIGENEYTGQVDADGNYSIDVDGDVLAENDTIEANVSGSDEAGNEFSADTIREYAVDTTAEAGITIDPVTDDNIVNETEAGQTIAITGSVTGDAAQGDTVTLTIGESEYTGQVDADGNYSINVDGDVLAANNTIGANVTGTDEAGNEFSADASREYAVDTTAEAGITIDAITGDDVVNGEEAEEGNQVTITGSVSGDAAEGDTVTLNIGQSEYTGQVDADGNYAIAVDGDVLASNDNVRANVSGADEAGNEFSADNAREYMVDTTAPTVEVTLGDDDAPLAAGEETSITIDFSEVAYGTDGSELDAQGVADLLSLNGIELQGELTQDGTDSTLWTGTVVAADGTNGNATASIADESYADEAGNLGSEGSDDIAVDTNAPDVTVTLGDDDAPLAAGEETSITIDFSEVAYDTETGEALDAAGVAELLSLNGIELQGELTQNGTDSTLWTGTVVAAEGTNGNATASIADESYADEAGNLGSEGSDNINVDTTAPTVEVTLGDDDAPLAAGEETSITIDFSEVAYGTDGSELDAQGVADLLSLSGIELQGELTQDGTDSTLWTGTVVAAEGTNGNATASIADESYADEAGNLGSEGSDNINVDTTAPTVEVTLGDDDAPLAAGEETSITIDFSEVAYGTDGSELDAQGVADLLSLNGIELQGELTQDGTDSTLWTGTVVAAEGTNGNASATIADESYADEAGNLGSESSDDIAVDTNAPDVTVTLGDDDAPLAAGEETSITIDFSEVAYGTDGSELDAQGVADLLSLNGIELQGELTQDGTDSTLWTGTVVAAEGTNGNASATIADESYADEAGNLGSEGSDDIAVDTNAPDVTVTLGDDDAPLAAGEETSITIDFSEVAYGTDGSELDAQGVADLLSLNGIELVGDLTQDGTDSTLWTGTVVAAEGTNGNASATIADESYADEAGNLGSEGSDNINVDTTAPTVEVTLGDYDAPLAAGEETSITIDFSEVAYDTETGEALDAAGVAELLSLNGIELQGELTQDGTDSTLWTGTVVAAEGTNGNASATIADESYADEAGNLGSEGSDDIAVDTNAPDVTVTLGDDDAPLAAGEETSITIDFSEVAYDTETGEALDAAGVADLLSLSGIELQGELTQDGTDSTLWTGTVVAAEGTNGNATASIADESYADEAGNLGSEGSDDIAVDTNAPDVTVTLGDDDAPLAAGEETSITIDFSEVAYGTDGSELDAQGVADLLSLNGIELQGELTQDGTDSTLWTGTVVAAEGTNGNASATIADESYADEAGNLGSEGSDDIAVDTNAPDVTVTLGDDDAPLAAGEETSITIDFSEVAYDTETGEALDAAGVADLLSLSGIELQGELTQDGTDSTLWTGTVVAAEGTNGNATASIADESYADEAGNLGSEGSDNINVDTTAPTVEVTLGDDDAPLAAGEETSITIDFSEVAYGTDGSELDAQGVADLLSLNGIELQGELTQDGTDSTLWTGTVVAAEGTNGNATASIADESYADEAGNLGSEGSDDIDINRAPDADDDTNTVEFGVGESVGGDVLSNDSDPDGDELTVTEVEGSAANVGAEIQGQFGTLTLNSDGSYDYVSNQPQPVLYGFVEGDNNLQSNLLESFALDTDALQRVQVTANKGVGVAGSNDGRDVPEQINDNGEVMVADMGDSIEGAGFSFGVSNLFNNESGGESGAWYTYNEAGELVGSGTFGPDDVAYQNGSNNVGRVNVSAEDAGDFRYIAFEGLAYENSGVDTDGGDYFLTDITLQESFDYTITDGEGGSDSATLTVDSTSNLAGYEIPLTLDESQTALVDEDGLENGLAGGPGDREGQGDDESTFTGKIGVAGAESLDFAGMDGQTATVGQEQVSYGWANGVLTATISDSPAEDREGEALFTVELDDAGNYTVTLLENVLHNTLDGEEGDNTENDASVVIDYSAQNADGDTQTGELTIDFNDDTPTVEEADTVTVTNEGIPNIYVGNVDFTGNQGSQSQFTFADGNVVVTGQGFESANDLDLVDAEVNQSGAGLGVDSDASPYHNLENEIDFRKTADDEASETLTIALQNGQVAYGAKIEFSKMFGGELETGVAEFYRDGELISTQSFSSDANSGNYADNFQVEDGGFDTIVLKADDNGKGPNHTDNSDFTVSSIEFTGSTGAPIGYAKSSLDVNYGADGPGSLALTGLASEVALKDGTPVTDIDTSDNAIVARDGDGELVFQLQLTPATGQWEFFQYQALEDGSLSVDYRATDADGDSVEASFALDAIANSAPESTNDEVNANAGEGLVLTTADFGEFSDPDSGDQLQSVRIDSLPDANAGVLTLNGDAVEAGDVISADAIANGDLVYTQTNDAAQDTAFDFSVSDGFAWSQESYSLAVNADSVPTASGETRSMDFAAATADPVSSNIYLTLDTSGSMNDEIQQANGEGTTTRFELAKDALVNMINSYDDMGNVNVKLTTFGAWASDYDWMSAADAITQIEQLQAGGKTNYEDAVAKTVSGADSAPAADQTIAYFISDGEPTTENDDGYNGEPGLFDGIYQDTWNDFVSNHINSLNVVALGGGITNTDYLDQLAEAGNNVSETLVVENESDLEAAIDPVRLTLDGDLNDNVTGGDGAINFDSITVDGTTYTAADFADGATIALQGDGQLAVDFAAGTYSYSATAREFNADTQKQFTVTVSDADGDTANFDVIFDINVDTQPTASNEQAITSDGSLEGNLLDNVDFSSDGQGANGGLKSLKVGDMSYTPDVNGDITINNVLGGTLNANLNTGEYTLSGAALGTTTLQVMAEDADGDEVAFDFDITSAGDNTKTETDDFNSDNEGWNSYGLDYDSAYVNDDRMEIWSDETVTKTYSGFNPGDTVEISFDARTSTGGSSSWDDNNGRWGDEFTVEANGEQKIQHRGGFNDKIKFESIADEYGNINLTIDNNSSSSDEHLYIDNVELTSGSSVGSILVGDDDSAEQFVLNDSSDDVTIERFDVANDVLDLSDLLDDGDTGTLDDYFVKASDEGSNVNIEITQKSGEGGSKNVTLKDVSAADLGVTSGEDFTHLIQDGKLDIE
ncbi:Ig-like domain-containing protein [Vreelandella janggokensis]|uniref:Ig-like domain-containing protein n=1 Tax=Vreelandella janggokensis TaxID=370767 RepID=A0ABT4IRZ1_9GAMM|nr:Ig-like domain-containing protein [Halomonas janggokensis]MCZ0925777.1 Ig-like domain-containing protein [Halomonas janggokensis]